MNKEELALLSYQKLTWRFNKIIPNEWYLSYSGGKDSHLLYWFIKKNNLPIKIVGINTRLEHDEIRDRINKNCDVILKPVLSMPEIKEKYGIPCFTKTQDQFIYSYQSGSKAKTTYERFFATKPSFFNVSNKAREYVLNGGHKISNKCCWYNKKKPAHDFEKETGLKCILGVRQEESKGRKTAYKSCLSTKNKFTPLFDFTEEMLNAMYEYYNIEIPEIYKYVDRTGCVGCPYEKCPEKTTKELELVSPNKARYIIEQFKESYEVKNVNYKHILDDK